MQPEPFPSIGPSIPVNSAVVGVGNLNSNMGSSSNSDETSYNAMGNGNNGESNNEENYEEAESLMAQQPTKVRPPAKFFLGKPQKHKNPSKIKINN